MKNQTHLEEIKENSLEDALPLSAERNQLQQLTEKEHKFFNFSRKTDNTYKLEIKNAERNYNDELARALKQEMEGYQKSAMNYDEKMAENKMFQKFLSLDFMIEDNAEDVEISNIVKYNTKFEV